MRDPRMIVITGASSGLGEALALGYAEPGRTLALTGRDPPRLSGVAARCRAAGARVISGVVDVTDRAAIAGWLSDIDRDQAVDLVIANAGISLGAGDGLETEATTRAVFATNVDGVLNTIQPLIPAMIARRRGQIALMASLAGFRGMPTAVSYCASKAAVRVYGEGLRLQLAPHGIGVSVICPGFVRTAMTAGNGFPMPFLMDAPRAGAIIRRGLARNRGRISFPGPMAFAVWLLASLPPAWTDAALRQAPVKPASAAASGDRS
ncbi:MAG: SDR family NAD(P)-dependent oxidoreductase [Azospirillaceae bacterium]|nr:SDR family NAD(P)-dependent oxidoreductase [Azospirillaceae bacterium]